MSNLNKGHAESVNAADGTQSGIVKNSVLSESANAQGSYKVTSIGPREFLRGLYIKLRNAADRMHVTGHLYIAFFIELLMRSMEEEKWADSINNLVVTVGKNELLDQFLAGSAYTAAFYLGLFDDTTYTGAVVGDTMASHGGWTENQDYAAGARPAPSWGAAAAGSKATTATAFAINATATIKGCFLTTNSTKGGTTGILYSAGVFTGGDKPVANGDTLNVTYTASV